ncbi:hypothetical protein MHI18_10960 [Peribacillus sp. FSL H8-0477]
MNSWCGGQGPNTFKFGPNQLHFGPNQSEFGPNKGKKGPNVRLGQLDETI